MVITCEYKKIRLYKAYTKAGQREPKESYTECSENNQSLKKCNNLRS